MIRRVTLAAAAAALALATGCRHRCGLNDREFNSTPFRPQAPNTPYLLPPANVPTQPAPNGAIVPGVGPNGSRNNFPPPNLDPLSPSRPAPEVLLPEDPPGGGSSRGGTPGGSGFGTLGGPVRPQTVEPARAATPKASGLTGFAKVKEGVATGRKPTLEGLDALKQAGYRTVIYLHPAGADVSAARGVVEKRNLSFLPIETTPESLAAALRQFNAAVADQASHPAYVYDDDGVRAGAMWYLHFRTAEAMNDDAARVRARPLGYADQGGEAKAFALAIQRHLETR